jgi:hypothetical protein
MEFCFVTRKNDCGFFYDFLKITDDNLFQVFKSSFLKKLEENLIMVNACLPVARLDFARQWAGPLLLLYKVVYHVTSEKRLHLGLCLF